MPLALTPQGGCQLRLPPLSSCGLPLQQKASPPLSLWPCLVPTRCGVSLCCSLLSCTSGKVACADADPPLSGIRRSAVKALGTP